jgi:transposase InsO family protein
MNQIYRAMGTSKQNMHQRLGSQLGQLEEKAQLKQIVSQVRADHPTMCAKSLYRKIRPKTMGRDRFFKWYRAEGFQIKPSKNWRRTTDSTGVIRFKNLVSDLELTAINQVWVSDITYYDIGDKFYYLTFVMDQYSRKIKGFHASKDLRTEQTTIPALKMAMRYLRPGQQPIIHSDGGGQYYSKSFLALTEGRFRNSMGESAYENPHAERLNGTMKNSYLKYYRPENFEELTRQLGRAVEMYNDGKPHHSLGGLTPIQFEKVKMTINQP